MKNLPPALRFLEANAWAMQARVFEALADIVQRHADGVRLDAVQVAAAIGGEDPATADPGEPGMVVAGGTAVIPLRGVIARYADQVNGICQPTGRSSESLIADLLRAAADPAVQRVVLRIDSPGGTVAGTAEVADAVRALSAQGKQVHAFVDGLAASAAYWIASQADEIIASAQTSEIGSIGVIGALVERSPANGTKVHVLRSTPLKAPGAYGSVSEEQIASEMRVINDLHEAFATAVAAGRGMTKEQQAKVATGEVFAASRAQALGMIDGVQPWGAFLARISTTDLRTVRGDRPHVVATLSASGNPPAASNAGAEPAPSPDTPAGTDPMKITAAVLASLVASDPMHAALISAMATGDPAKGIQPATEDEIRASITSAKSKALTDRVAALEAKATADAAANTAALAAKDAQIAALQAKADKGEKLGALAAGAGKDPGADHVGANLSAEDKLKAEWNALDAAQQMGFCNDFDGFKAWKANAHRDRSAAAADKADAAATASKKEG